MWMHRLSALPSEVATPHLHPHSGGELPSRETCAGCRFMSAILHGEADREEGEEGVNRCALRVLDVRAEQDGLSGVRRLQQPVPHVALAELSLRASHRMRQFVLSSA